MRTLLNARHVLPLMIFFGALTIGMRTHELWNAASTGQLPNFSRAHAEESKSDAPPAIATPNQADTIKESAKPAEGGKSAEAPPAQSTATLPEPSAPPSAEDDASPAELDVLKQLSKRRDQLDKRNHDLDTREALIKVGEQRVDQKIKEMESLRLQLQSMVDQINSAQQAQIANLVKIYETMKPADAAKIFENLDMPVLLGVIQKMKPKSTAPILAAMAPEKAKEVTVALTKQDQLPKPK